jgi:hypothetical protein
MLPGFFCAKRTSLQPRRPLEQNRGPMATLVTSSYWRQSMIDVLGNDALTLTQATKLLPPGRNGARAQISTLIRWIINGVKKSDGSRIRLEAQRLGCKWITSRAAIAQFSQELTPQLSDEQQQTPAPSSVAPRTPGQRQRAADQAAKRLEAVGI